APAKAPPVEALPKVGSAGTPADDDGEETNVRDLDRAKLAEMLAVAPRHTKTLSTAPPLGSKEDLAQIVREGSHPGLGAGFSTPAQMAPQRSTDLDSPDESQDRETTVPTGDEADEEATTVYHLSPKSTRTLVSQAIPVPLSPQEEARID